MTDRPVFSGTLTLVAHTFAPWISQWEGPYRSATYPTEWGFWQIVAGWIGGPR